MPKTLAMRLFACQSVVSRSAVFHFGREVHIKWYEGSKWRGWFS